MRTEKKHRLAQLRHWRVRKKVAGTRERPRMSVCFTNRNIHVQFIDDVARVTLAAASTMSKAMPDRDNLAANVKSAQVVGEFAAKVALEKGIKKVVFDRGSARYHGKVKALADAARAAGLEF
ncbi:MAG TPA: 50S ribosomal protein L18 [Verrucomicrobia bacterium]|nr:50S ribosomal protein L18 [Verrucomicrobiota bacterium]HOP98155.1 50S ribosomal protein L18 [Verrucomicrobiota bacterium]HPU54746.1 50S ribosomal protein L18 [Verrucomicrobiota bacterium]